MDAAKMAASITNSIFTKAHTAQAAQENTELEQACAIEEVLEEFSAKNFCIVIMAAPFVFVLCFGVIAFRCFRVYQSKGKKSTEK